ncbi:hypothetical protein EK904_014682 [Melospiza melodia maxima]|nr:hypothetical protein EK904_014682 [Melospiza melodia maxima]
MGSCPKPDRQQNAELDESSRDLQDFPPGTKISFTCRPGYIRVPGKSLTWTCGNNLQWSQTSVFCTVIPCEPPPRIANGEYEERGSYVYQSSVTYRCLDVPEGSDPFSLIGSDTIYCTSDAHSNGVWSGLPPECRVVKCEDPRVENGRKMSGFGLPYRYKDSVVFECNQGYFMVGAQVITCEADNIWVPPQPTCEKITPEMCLAPKIPNGALIPAKGAYAKGEAVQIRCNAGCSFPDGSAEMTVTCQEQSSWGALQHCSCESEGGYIIAIICVIVVVVVLLAAFWIYKKFFSQNGKRDSTPSSAEYKMCKA